MANLNLNRTSSQSTSTSTATATTTNPAAAPSPLPDEILAVMADCTNSTNKFHTFGRRSRRSGRTGTLTSSTATTTTGSTWSSVSAANNKLQRLSKNLVNSVTRLHNKMEKVKFPFHHSNNSNNNSTSSIAQNYCGSLGGSENAYTCGPEEVNYNYNNNNNNNNYKDNRNNHSHSHNGLMTLTTATTIAAAAATGFNNGNNNGTSSSDNVVSLAVVQNLRKRNNNQNNLNSSSRKITDQSTNSSSSTTTVEGRRNKSLSSTSTSSSSSSEESAASSLSSSSSSYPKLSPAASLGLGTCPTANDPIQRTINNNGLPLIKSLNGTVNKNNNNNMLELRPINSSRITEKGSQEQEWSQKSRRGRGSSISTSKQQNCSTMRNNSNNGSHCDNVTTDPPNSNNNTSNNNCKDGDGNDDDDDDFGFGSFVSKRTNKVIYREGGTCKTTIGMGGNGNRNGQQMSAAGNHEPIVKGKYGSNTRPTPCLSVAVVPSCIANSSSIQSVSSVTPLLPVDPTPSSPSSSIIEVGVVVPIRPISSSTPITNSSSSNSGSNNASPMTIPTMKNGHANPNSNSTPSKLTVTILEEEPELRNAAWFQGGIPREIALEVLRNESIGAFIVRESTTKSGCLALSLRVPKQLASQPTGIAHYLILKTGKGYKIKGFTKEFASLSSLITHHSVMPELLPCPLALHLYRSTKLPMKTSGRFNSADFVEPEKLLRGVCNSSFSTDF